MLSTSSTFVVSHRAQLIETFQKEIFKVGKHIFGLLW